MRFTVAPRVEHDLSSAYGTKFLREATMPMNKALVLNIAGLLLSSAMMLAGVAM